MLEAVRQNVGFLITGLSLVGDDLRVGRIVLPFPDAQHLTATMPYVLTVPGRETTRPQLKRFCDWLCAQSVRIRNEIAAAGADIAVQHDD